MDNIIIDYSAAEHWKAEAAEWEDRYNKMFNVCEELRDIIKVLDPSSPTRNGEIIKKMFLGEVTAEDLLSSTVTSPETPKM